MGMQIKGATTVLKKPADFYGWSVERLINEIDGGWDDNLNVIVAYEVYKMHHGYRWSGTDGETWVRK